MAFRATRFAWSWSATAPRNTTIRQYIKETLKESPEKLEKLKKVLGKKGQEVSQEAEKASEKPAQDLKKEATENVKQTAQELKNTDYEGKAKEATTKMKKEFEERSSDVLEDARRDGMLKEKNKKGIKKE
ncbi:fungal protein [Schizosaccharomyces cryophilus OY26]|uniref:Fungal protein n=1 Tax=Schizosaccharomyces cryophilus (strain OY26 / ATCC MYA-4695 / CBS 11777 / NBRC 106824 / NRRL Y48691) TaxID=653667 RepID=S9W281_SCHCR|nr:uncharacterized protein SPOG_01792 [Schizosaccharomyces cryophilus OY26]EPY52469.1 fungal protein [Schizosaccharomyces cryophilus OY26]